MYEIRYFTTMYNKHTFEWPSLTCVETTDIDYIYFQSTIQKSQRNNIILPHENLQPFISQFPNFPKYMIKKKKKKKKKTIAHQAIPTILLSTCFYPLSAPWYNDSLPPPPLFYLPLLPPIYCYKKMPVGMNLLGAQFVVSCSINKDVKEHFRRLHIYRYKDELWISWDVTLMFLFFFLISSDTNVS